MINYKILPHWRHYIWNKEKSQFTLFFYNKTAICERDARMYGKLLFMFISSNAVSISSACSNSSHSIWLSARSEKYFEKYDAAFLVINHQMKYVPFVMFPPLKRIMIVMCWKEISVNHFLSLISLFEFPVEISITLSPTVFAIALPFACCFMLFLAIYNKTVHDEKFKRWKSINHPIYIGAKYHKKWCVWNSFALFSFPKRIFRSTRVAEAAASTSVSAIFRLAFNFFHFCYVNS